MTDALRAALAAMLDADDQDAARAMARAALAAPVAPAVPAGWVLVPVEPTEEMADAGDNTSPVAVTSEWTARDVWDAMIAAAPEPAAVKESLTPAAPERAEDAGKLADEEGLEVTPLYAAPQPTPGPTLSEWAKTAKVGDVATVSVGIIPKQAEAAAVPSAEPEPEPEPEPETGKWEGAEEWMPLAWELCADECGEDACNELVWEGGPVPEPWGDRWLKYEDEAKRLIALVRKHVPAAPPPAAVPQPLTDEQIAEICADCSLVTPSDIYFARAIEAAHGIGITGAAKEQQP